MNCNVHEFYKMIFSNKFGFILETSLFLYYLTSPKQRLNPYFVRLGRLLLVRTLDCFGHVDLEWYLFPGNESGKMQNDEKSEHS